MTDISSTLTQHELEEPFRLTNPAGEPLAGPTRMPIITDGQSFKYLQYVRHHDVEAFKAKGWVVSDDLSGTHHGYYSQLMEWRGEGEPE